MAKESALEKVVRLSAERHVKTPEGVRKFGKPIGSPLGTGSFKSMPVGSKVRIQHKTIARAQTNFTKTDKGWKSGSSVVGTQQDEYLDKYASDEMAHHDVLEGHGEHGDDKPSAPDYSKMTLAELKEAEKSIAGNTRFWNDDLESYNAETSAAAQKNLDEAAVKLKAIREAKKNAATKEAASNPEGEAQKKELSTLKANNSWLGNALDSARTDSDYAAAKKALDENKAKIAALEGKGSKVDELKAKLDAPVAVPVAKPGTKVTDIASLKNAPVGTRVTIAGGIEMVKQKNGKWAQPGSKVMSSEIGFADKFSLKQGDVKWA